MEQEEIKLTGIGLGYVGLRLVLEFGKKFSGVGFGINKRGVSELRNGRDFNLETDTDELAARSLSLTTALKEFVKSMTKCRLHVPTIQLYPLYRGGNKSCDGVVRSVRCPSTNWGTKFVMANGDRALRIPLVCGALAELSSNRITMSLSGFY